MLDIFSFLTLTSSMGYFLLSPGGGMLTREDALVGGMTWPTDHLVCLGGVMYG